VVRRAGAFEGVEQPGAREVVVAENTEFDLRGVNHIALVCRDMAATVDFYTNVLGMPLTKTINLPRGGQHFFFDIGNGDSLAFFWFPGAPEAVPGVASAANLPGKGDISSAHGSMNHLAFNVPLDKFEAYRERLVAKGVEVSPVVDHDDSPSGIAKEFYPGVFVRSCYFRDPDGILLEFAAWTRTMGQEGDVQHAPVNADGKVVEVAAR
jgi:catechol 2,3-dioxygenase-like lactoylglutathione lyase family enzyme